MHIAGNPRMVEPRRAGGLPSGLVSEKSSEALRGRTRTGSLLVGAVVRRVAEIHPASGGLGAGCPREDMACCRRLEATRPHRDGRSSEESWLPTETSPALLASSPRLIFSASIAR